MEKMQSKISDLKNQLMEAHSQIDQKEKGKEDLERSVRGLRKELETANKKVEREISVSEGLKRSQIMDKHEIETLEKKLEDLSKAPPGVPLSATPLPGPWRMDVTLGSFDSAEITRCTDFVIDNFT